MKETVTMGISTNTRLVGVAIIHKEEILDYFVRLYKSSWSPEKVTQIITSFEPCVRKYSIKKVVLSIPPTHYQTNEFRELIKALTEFFTQQHIPIVTESVHALQVFCKANGRFTKKKLMRCLAEQFQDLHGAYAKEMRNKNKYYIKAFEAVGMAMLHNS